MPCSQVPLDPTNQVTSGIAPEPTEPFWNGTGTQLGH